MSYKNLKDKAAAKPRLVLVYGEWHCYSFNACGTGNTQKKAHKDWWWKQFQFLKALRNRKGEWAEASRDSVLDQMNAHRLEGARFGYYSRVVTPVGRIASEAPRFQH